MTEDPRGAVPRRRFITRGGAVRSLVNLAAVLLLYFAIPLDTSSSGVRVAVNIALTVLAIGTVTYVLLREFRLARDGGEEGLRPIQLIVFFEIVLVIFSVAIYSLAMHGTDQMSGVHTRMDALYFSAVTMATVGYGDIHATGQAAKAVVTAQIAFDVIFIATFVRLLTQAVQTKVTREERDGTDPETRA